MIYASQIHQNYKGDNNREEKRASNSICCTIIVGD
jgi:hypothetical protein